MEVKSVGTYFNNADYESSLFVSNSSIKSGEYFWQPSALNREFEYFILLLEKAKLLSSKLYDPKYLDFLEHLSGNTIEIETDVSKASISKARPWWSPITTWERDRKLHSKITSMQISAKLGFPDDMQLAQSSQFLEKLSGQEKLLFKEEGGMSGKGHYVWPKEKDKILKVLELGRKLVVQPLRRRVCDFSCLFLSDDQMAHYENVVDENFQYKGTRFADFELPKVHRAEYLDLANKVKNEYRHLGADFPFCIDSYLYVDALGTAQLCAVSEVNTRKTMGFIAYRLKDLFRANFASFYLSRKRLSETPKDVYLLSPAGNLFQAYFIVADSLADLTQKEDLLFRGLKSLELKQNAV